MGTWMRLAAFAAGMAVLFVAAMGVGRAVGPASGSAPASSNHGGSAHSGDAGHPGHSGAPTPAGGLGVSQDGYTLVAESVTFSAGTPAPFRFTITDRDGQPVTSFMLNHDRRMHLVLARRDLSGYQHLHPTMAPDGTWSVRLALAAPGSALGHLVVLRQGDLGYLHVHPVDGLIFQAGAPVAGTYRMYLDFKHENRVRTAEFTARVRGAT